VFRTALDDFGLTDGYDPTGEYVSIAFNSFHAILRTLVATKFNGGTEGNKLFPDLAAAEPTISSDGQTYTFKLKPNVKFGPPLNRAITSKDVEYAFERINTASLVAQYGSYYCGVIKGMDCAAKSVQPVSGIETPDDATIVFHLEQPTGDFLYRLAMPATAPIPQEVAKCFTKAGDYGRFVVASGPYMIKGSDQLDTSSCSAMKPISGFDPSRKLLLVRNPAYDQSTDDLRSNFVDGVQITVDTNVNDIFNRVESGALDASYVNQPPKTILARYVTDPSKRKFLHADSSDQTWYITMNLDEPPFDDIHVRKAVNLVMDKAAILQAWGGQVWGQIATHIMPPTVLGNQLTQSYDPYNSAGLHGDVTKAQEEMKQEPGDRDPQRGAVHRHGAGRHAEPREARDRGEAARACHQRGLPDHPDHQEQDSHRHAPELDQGLRRPVHLRLRAVRWEGDQSDRQRELLAGRHDPAAGHHLRGAVPQPDPQRRRRRRGLREARRHRPHPHHLLGELRQETDGTGRPLGPLPLVQQHHPVGPFIDPLRLRPVVVLHLPDPTGREQQAERQLVELSRP
jgi:hypothetical protein